MRLELLYQNLTKYAHDTILFLDESLKIVEANDRAFEFYGYSYEELLQMSLYDLHSSGTIELAKARILGLNKHKDGFLFETIQKKKNGLEFPVEISARCIEKEGNSYYLCIARDITERREAAEKIYKLNMELEDRVRERTRQLEVANKKLEEANRELEAFSYSVSHDLQAPLRSIDGFSFALLEDYGNKLDEKAREHIMRVRSSTRRMEQLISDMLKLSRITRAEMHFEKVNLSDIISTLTREMLEIHPGRQIKFNIAEGVEVEGDPALLRIMLENIMGNAVKFTVRSSQPVIEFGSYKDKEGTVYYIKDNGIGFDMAYAGKLFGPFQRLHSGKDFPGNGIGLATVKRIALRHGGGVWAESSPGMGAAFYFRLGGTGGEE